MCLVVNRKWLKYTDEDVEVWKVVDVNYDNETWTGPYKYNDRAYPFNKAAHEEGPDMEKAAFGNNLIIGEGMFHFHMYYDAAVRYIKMLRNSALDSTNFRICKCTVPKESLFARGKNEGVSDTLVVHKMRVMDKERSMEKIDNQKIEE